MIRLERGAYGMTSVPTILLIACFLTLPVCLASAGEITTEPRSESSSLRWWKGNLHTHSFWSDGNDFPEMIVDWYKQQGYHFLALSDHNVLSQGERWMEIVDKADLTNICRKYLDRFGPQWVERKEQDGKELIRLKPLSEFRHLFEEPDRFLLIQGEEISDGFEKRPIHLNATNLLELIPPQGGASVLEVMQKNVNAVLEQRTRTGQPMLPHINHPNFGWALTAEEMAQVKGERFFEVYNGHPGVANYGDEYHTDTERIWDIVLALRLSQPQPEVMYGVATDDAHHYHEFGVGKANAGRGWIVVRSAKLTPEQIIEAMESGDFYASSGVRLKDFGFRENTVTLQIEPKPGVQYTTRFIGTVKGYSPIGEEVQDAEGKVLPVTRRYGEEIGKTLAEVEGTEPSYTLKGNELYVRAKVISSKIKDNPFAEGDYEVAWTQPVMAGQ